MAVSVSGKTGVLASVSWTTTAAGSTTTEPKYENVTVVCTSNGVTASAPNTSVAWSAGRGWAEVPVSSTSWDAESHVTNCSATVYYSYAGVASSATAYSTSAWGRGRRGWGRD